MTTYVLNLFSVKLKSFLGVISLFFLTTAAMAQAPVAGYDYLGSCSGHNYYISQSFVFGNQISVAVADFQSKTVVPDNQVYAAAIVNAAENACITSLMLTYNTLKYGGVPLSDFPNWMDTRNAWIGLTDVAMEGTFVWSNGQPNCENYRNWNVDEPNNFAGNASNGEDYTQLLMMKPYPYNSGTNDPLGKWNDWFNQNIMSPDGTVGAPTKLPVIIEVGPAECQPTQRGNRGCSHGYWKNADTKAWTDAGYSRTAKFSAVFGVTNGRGVITLGTTTMQDALELNGGGYAQVAKQGVAALLNAGQGFYPYTTAEIITAVQSMFNNGSAMLPAVNVNGTNYTGGTFTTANALANYLDMLNNLGCPLNNAGNMSSSAITQMNLEVGPTQFKINGYPNPSKTGFNIQMNGFSNEKVSIRVIDISGRLVEQRANLSPNQVLTIGNNYKVGTYNIEVLQGSKKQQLKMVKQ